MKRPLSISFSSTVTEFENLRFYAFPKDKAVDVAKIAQSNGYTVYADKDGTLYSAYVRHSGHYVFGRGTADNFVRCAAKLGLITKQQAKKHLSDASEHDKKQDEIRRANDFRSAAKRLGVVLNKRQLSKLKSFPSLLVHRNKEDE